MASSGSNYPALPGFVDSDHDDDDVSHLVANSLYASLASLYMSDKHSDMTIICNGRIFPTHRAVLCSQSAFFDKAMTSGFRESSSGIVQLPDDDPVILERFLQFIYLGSYDDGVTLEWLGQSRIRHMTSDEVDEQLAPASGVELSACDPGQSGYDEHTDGNYDPPDQGQPATEAGAESEAEPDADEPPEEYDEFSGDEEFAELRDHLHQQKPWAGVAIKYAMDESLREPLPLRRVLDDRTRELFLHLRLYVMADKFDVHGLKLLARNRFYHVAESYWNRIEAFPAVLDELYRTTPPGDQGLREIVHKLAAWQITSYGTRGWLNDVMRTHSDFTSGVLDHIIIIFRNSIYGDEEASPGA